MAKGIFSGLAGRVSALQTRALAALTVAALTGLSGEAAAQSSAGGIANTVSNSLTGMGNLLLGGAFLGGVALCGAGLLKVKEVSDSDGRDSYGPAIWRLGVGGGLVALPALSGAMSGTLFGGSTPTPAIQSGVGWRVN